MVGNLSGITVLDLSTVGPGSRCTAVLRDLGARLVKVLAPAREKRIEPEWFAYGAHRHVRRVRLNVRHERGRDAFLRMARSADVIVESFRPGVARKLGIAYEDVRGVNEAIVYASLSGYGQEGPYAQWAGHDLNYLAVGGFLCLQGERVDGGPALPGATIADAAAGGWQAAIAICAALVQRARTGEGQHLDVSTVDGVLALASLNVDEHLATGAEPRAGATLLTGKYACYDVYRCRDGKWLSLGAIEPKFFVNLCSALALEHLVSLQYDDARQGEVRDALRTAFAARDRDEWVRELGPRDACVAPVLSIAEVARNEHFRARGAFGEVEHEGRGYEQVAPAIAGATRGAEPVRAVTFDATDTRALLSEAGLSDADVSSLIDEGIAE